MYAKLKLSNVKQRHIPRGRPNRLPQNPQAEITLFLRRMRLVDGRYDQGGANWGPPAKTGSMWCAFAPPSQPPVEIFVRAQGRVQAALKVLDILPNASLKIR